MMCSIAWIMSALFRQLVLPNPFIVFGTNAILYQLVAEIIISIASYGLLRCFFVKKKTSEIRCFCFVIMYAALTGVLFLWEAFSFAWWCLAVLVAMFMLIMCIADWVSDMILD